MSLKSEKAMAVDPLEESDLLADTFYRPAGKNASARRSKKKVKKPTHYKICCISLYNEDIQRLENMVTELKSRGYTKANKSQIIRYALSKVDLDKMPKDI